MSDGISDLEGAPGASTGWIDVGGMLEEVREGLARMPKELPPKYFYDRHGSELFERITRLPEYYLTRAELEILRDGVHDWILSFAPASLVELGAGSARKTRILLEAMMEARSAPLFVPVDVSADVLAETAGELRDEYPELIVEPEVADFARSLDFDVSPERPALFALLGSTIGNFGQTAARRLLGRIRRRMECGDAFLTGADLRPGPDKPIERLEAAYDDALGVTARFNRNMLQVLNRELGTDFEPEAFEHRAFYDEDEARIEMHLVARRRQSTRLPDGTKVAFEPGESVRTEISCKYDRQTVETLFHDADLELVEGFSDARRRYAVALGRPGSPPRDSDGARRAPSDP